jgi:superfamily II DNA or RNA helicase
MPDLAPHQIAAAARLLELLDRYGGALLADEAGLGKSFVAAEVAHTQQLRGAAVEVIVPASLVAQWRDTLHDFDVDARLLTHDSLMGQPFVATPGERLVIVDEAHTFRTPRTQRYDALARRSIAARLLLVTATPVCNAAGDLFALVALVAADDALRHHGVASIEEAFARDDFRAIDAIACELIVRRGRDVLPPELHFGELERRVVRYPLLDAPIDTLQFPLSASVGLLRQFLWRRLESSEEALIESVHRQIRFYERVLESGRSLSRRDYRRAFSADEDGDAYQQILFWDLWAPAGAIDAAAVHDEMKRLRELQSIAETAPPTKRDLLVQALPPEPALIFTAAAATARMLARHLRCGLATARDGSAAIERFRHGAIDRLVATDLASEGLNLQRAAAVVHYDLPWNPVRLDQRNGRAHRIGQQRPLVRAIYFLPDHTPTRILETIAAKNRARRRVLARRGAPPFDAESLRALPPHLPRHAAAVVLLRALGEHGLAPPAELRRRQRAGVERLMQEMAGEYLDRGRVGDLAELLAAERAVCRGE